MSNRKPFQQLAYLFYEVRLHVNFHWWRWFGCWFSSPVIAVCAYRLDRFFYLLLGGRIWALIRIFLSPLSLFLRPWLGRCEIHYRADIGKGLKILHPGLGIVVSGQAMIGEHLTLTGGNCIGGRSGMKVGDLVLGNKVSLGANAVILGPARIGNNVQIGAGAVVVKDANDNTTLVGVPALPVNP